MSQLKIIFNRLKELSRKMIITSFLSLVIAAGYFAHGAFSEPTADPSASDQDFTENILGANSADNNFDSTSVVANADGSIIERLNYIKENLGGGGIDYSLQKNQIYDDLNCVNNNEEADTACGATDAEYTGEESTWTLYTDASLSGALVASGKVYLDERTGLYWADAHDLVSGNNTPDAITNEFTIGTGCSDAQINAGECDSSMYQTKGNAVQYCLDLSLDADGDGTDETTWYLPSQKELMQAYINGSGNNIPNPAVYYWSASEYYSNASYAWYVNLSNGGTGLNGKTNGTYARCVLR
ncbi:MAG: DUF1566 domain-containing protein [Patescibacteria group bacterium]|jgi:hypothetical protein|nr:DUF1566 domain-containing protein [Patescibacteria group bacterium]